MEKLIYRYHNPVEITDYPINKKDKCVECVDEGDQEEKDIVLSGKHEKGEFDYCKSCLKGAIWRLRGDKSLLNEEVLNIVERKVGIESKWRLW
jgi:hypothetical protein